MYIFIFFFKQKTAYEMRISDWSSDVCSSDLVSVWAFRRTWNGWIIAWMLPGAALGVAAGWFYADRVNEAQLMAALGAITLAFGLYRLWIEIGRASCRERVCQIVEISVGVESLKKKQYEHTRSVYTKKHKKRTNKQHT